MVHLQRKLLTLNYRELICHEIKHVLRIYNDLRPRVKPQSSLQDRRRRKLGDHAQRLNCIVWRPVRIRLTATSEGLLFSADQCFTKAVSGLGVMVSGGVLSLIAVPGDAKPGAVNPELIFRLGALYLPTVIGMTLVAIGLLFVYRIDRMQHERNLATLRASETDEIHVTPELAPLVT